jgi:hypothetical protein
MTWVLLVFLSTGVLNLGSYPDEGQCRVAIWAVQTQLNQIPHSEAFVACVSYPKPRA